MRQQDQRQPAPWKLLDFCYWLLAPTPTTQIEYSLEVVEARRIDWCIWCGSGFVKSSGKWPCYILKHVKNELIVYICLQTQTNHTPRLSLNLNDKNKTSLTSSIESIDWVTFKNRINSFIFNKRKTLISSRSMTVILFLSFALRGSTLFILESVCTDVIGPKFSRSFESALAFSNFKSYTDTYSREIWEKCQNHENRSKIAKILRMVKNGKHIIRILDDCFFIGKKKTRNLEKSIKISKILNIISLQEGTWCADTMGRKCRHSRLSKYTDVFQRIWKYV